MKLYLAPLHGVTNRIFRESYFRHFGGFDGAMAPFILAVASSKARPNHFKDLLPGPAAESSGVAGVAALGVARRVPLVPQLLGNEAAAFVETARVLAGLGYGEIDWNLGCPHPMVANKERGSGLLPFPDRIAKVLDAACAIPGIAISVKLRLGRSDPLDIERLMPVLNGYPLAKVIIHPRLGTQMYRGEVDLEGFARAAGLCSHTVVYNGDIVDRASYEALASRFPGVHEWMIGRGALRDPFLAEDIKAIAARDVVAHGDVADRPARLRAWHEELYRSYRAALSGPAHVLDKMKEVWGYLGASFPERPRQLERLSRAKTLEAYEAAVAQIL
jgi:tRNA-dihydrouridine synthase